MATFLQKNYSEDDLEKLAEHLDFNNFQKNHSVNMEALRDLGMLLDNDQKCVRKGKIGTWNEFFDHDLNCRANKWVEKNLKQTDLKFPQEVLANLS